MLFYAVWKEDRASLLIDAKDQEQAEEIATKVGEDDNDPPPAVVMAVPPGVMVFECLYEDTDNPEEAELVIDPLDVSAVALAALEERIDAELSGAAVLPPGKARFRVVQGDGLPARCKSKALDAQDRTIQCEKAAGHVDAGDPEHAGEGSVWS